jgi:hypothetical protein
MPRFYPDSVFTLQAFVRDENGTLTNADDVAFFWRMKHWNQGRSDETGTVVNASTGVYEVEVNPQEGGNMYFRWEVTTPDIVQESVINIADTQFPAEV